MAGKGTYHLVKRWDEKRGKHLMACGRKGGLTTSSQLQMNLALCRTCHGVYASEIMKSYGYRPRGNKKRNPPK